MSRLKTGERREMRSRFRHDDKPFEVHAFCEDSDTPVIILRDSRTGQETHLTDVQAQSLEQRLQRARSVLPTSK